MFIGHQDRETDFAMAAAVPGIDVILGTHSHYKGALQQIPGTTTWFISPFQYLNYLSQVSLTFRGGSLLRVEGSLGAWTAPEHRSAAGLGKWDVCSRA